MRFRLYAEVLLLGLLLSLCPSAFSQDAMHLFHKMQDALGGADKIAAINDFEESVRANAWDQSGNSMGVVRKRVRFIRPSHLRLDQVGQRDSYVLYFDGTSGWEILPDGTVADLKDGELTFARNYLYGFNLNIWLADRDPRYAIESPAPNVVTIVAKDDSWPGMEITLDPATFLPIKTAGISHADPAHPVTSATRLERWHEVAGVKFPEVTTSFHNGTKVAEIIVEETKVNRVLKTADLSAKPKDLKPVMSLVAR